jgi:hypothetical protein
MKRGLIRLGLIGAFIFAIAFSVSPQLHERIHPDANQPQHECAVTLIAAGNYDHTVATPVIEPAIALNQFCTPSAIHSIWIAPSFLSACIFEHAPPRPS